MKSSHRLSFSPFFNTLAVVGILVFILTLSATADDESTTYKNLRFKSANANHNFNNNNNNNNIPHTDEKNAVAAPSTPKNYKGFFFENDSETSFEPAANEQEWIEMLKSVGLPLDLKYTTEITFPTPSITPSLPLPKVQVSPPKDPYGIFTKLFGPEGLKIFASAFERNFLHVRHPAHANGGKCEICDILRIKDVPLLATTSTLSYEKNIRMVINGTEFYKSNKFATYEEVLRAYLAGSTVVINSVQYFHQGLNELVYQLEAALGGFVGINIYMSPPLAQGFKAHHDMMDTLIYQAEGTKYWRVCSQYVKVPLDFHAGQFTIEELNDRNCTDIYMVPGDVLYLPRGTIHAPYTSGNNSLHYTIGMNWSPLFVWDKYFDTYIRAIGTKLPDLDPSVDVSKPTIPSDSEVIEITERKDIILAPKSVFFADKYELDNAFRKKKPMSVPVSGLLFNILQTIMSDADITDFRRAFPIWTLAGTPNTFPNERDTIDIYAHIRKLKDLLIEYGTSHYKSIQYYLYYAGPRYKRIERRIQQSKEGRSNSAKQGVFDLFAKMAGFHWDKAVEKLLDAMPESEEERIEKERNMAAVKALLDGVTPELEDLLFAVCIEEYREKILGGLISRPLDFRSLGHIAEITLNSVLQRRPNVNAGISPANPLKYKMSQLFPGQEDHNMIILVINRNNFQIHSNKAPIFIYILETHGRPFTPNEIADVMMGIPVGSWKSQQSPALQSNAVTEHGKSEGNNDDNDNNESQIVKERRKIEKQAIRIVQQCVEWGLLSITSLETKKENKLGFIVHDEVEEYFAPAYSGY